MCINCRYLIKKRKIDDVEEEPGTSSSFREGNKLGEIQEIHDLSDDDSCCSDGELLNTLKGGQRQNFRQKWSAEFLWVINKANSAFCKYCSIKLPNNKCHLQRHEKSKRHLKCTIAVKNQPQISIQTDEFISEQNKIKLAELTIIMFIIQNNLPLLLIKPLIELIKNVAVDSKIATKIQIGKTKATETIKTVLLNDANKSISEILQTKKISMIIDETTDISTTKCLAIVVRYFDEIKSKVRDRFLALLELENFDARSIFQGITELFSNLNISLNNCIGFSSDNAAVMVGKNNSVRALLLKKNPHLFTMGCMCHSIHLCSRAAAKKLPSNIETFVRNVYFYFCHSSKRQIELRQFQEAFNIKKHKILKASSTRWFRHVAREGAKGLKPPPKL